MEFRRQSLVQALSCSMYLKLSKEGYNPSLPGFRQSFETLKCHGGAGPAGSFIERRERLHVPTKAEEPNFFGCRGSEDFKLGFDTDGKGTMGAVSCHPTIPSCRPCRKTIPRFCFSLVAVRIRQAYAQCQRPNEAGKTPKKLVD